ncbi:hypothetical protein GOODEAATRI_007289, partial [Goodea atripinnis]
LQVTTDYTPRGRHLVHSLRVVVGLFLGELAVVVEASPAVLASYDEVTTPRCQKGHPPQPMLAYLTTNSRMPILPTTRTVRLSAHILHMPTMDMSKSHRRSSSFPYLFRLVSFIFLNS